VGDGRDRSQVGIETLVIFVAMILVAAVGAGMLVNTAGILQSKASTTSQDSQALVTNQLQVIGVTGAVTDDYPWECGSYSWTDYYPEYTVYKLTITVKKAHGADPIDLSGATVYYSGRSEPQPNDGGLGRRSGQILTHETFRTESTTSQCFFAAYNLTDEFTTRNAESSYTLGEGSYRPNTSDWVLRKPGDKIDVVVPLGVSQAGHPLQPGDVATIKMITASGTKKPLVVQVPPTLTDTSPVSL
jgi:flagellin FlaB